MQNFSELFERLLKGDEKALEEVLVNHHNYLMVVGCRYLRDRQRVEDVIHDVFADLWNSNKKIEISVGVKSFLRGAVINKCLAIIRKDSKMDFVENHSHDIVSKETPPDTLVDEVMLKSAIEEIIESLPDKCKVVFKKSRLENKSHQEISNELDISKKTIENHMTKALRTLREELSSRDMLVLVLLIITYNG